ncbi:hypothetical protein NC653_016488 [Populus alba x Populus x berolinensis]|uniref:Uncharacterized protein n=1 Tax=Populus alba x Populus x berolinensis TaxID=444605 RepID=A0AAD6QN22_9ROSI|nr:hypothetical protein NC653_016488 [Populus alba x Populus x berolinensis]
MGYVMIVSLPVILFILIVALAFYLLGRARGRSEAARIPQYHGPPAPPAPPFQFQPPPQEKPSPSHV